jgi:hypothetical protein
LSYRCKGGGCLLVGRRSNLGGGYGIGYFLLVCISGVDWIVNLVRVIKQFSRLPVMRCFMRSCKRDIPDADTGQLGIVGRPVRLCLVGRKRSLMANFVER